MLKDLHVAHLTGTVTVVENHLFTDVVTRNRNARTIGQMFFKPYESKKEFIFCARHTLQPLAMIGVAVLSPFSLVGAGIVFSLAEIGLHLFALVNVCTGNESSAHWALNLAEEVFSRLCQSVINLVVLPLTALAMLTRGISTGLKAADIYDYDAPEVPSTLAPN
ncbi:hypothetical protein [Legionella maioricensis]|uniref:Uncharacterized protein n=1 Tax=Legionella maioricensis TaxID=2896528 RepID=A0A9X2CXH4_9GAMM|nr:hypothetical protein [Legionella maioricensis]MCL9682571.1 hypothetical protein [Legionella maioricensis]MCL9686182.1 hypothetical protein [Legionella maioricensis]